MKKFRFLLTLSFLLGLHLKSSASMTVVIKEVGNDVIATYSGTVDTTELSFFGNFSISAALDSDSFIHFTNGGVTGYTGIVGPASIGLDVNSRTLATSFSGDVFGFTMGNGQLRLPIAYVSGTMLSGSTIWNGESLHSLGILKGVYTWTWGSGESADSLTVEVSAEPFPAAANETQFVLESALFVDRIWNVAVSGFDGTVYYTRRATGTNVLGIVSQDGTSVQTLPDSVYQTSPSSAVSTIDRPSGIFIDPDDGDIFVAEDFGGSLRRVPQDYSLINTWITSSSFDPNDSDPAGGVVVPEYYTGDVVNVGDGLIVDRGNSGSEFIFRFSPDTSGNPETLLTFNTNSSLYGIVATDTQIIAVEQGVGLRELTFDGANFNLETISTTMDLSLAIAATWDNQRKVLYVVLTDNGADSSSVAEYNPATGNARTIIDNLGELWWSSVAISKDGSRLYLAEYSASGLHSELRTYTIVDAPPPVESFYEANYERFFDRTQEFDAGVRRFGGPVTVPTGSGETAAIDFSVSPYPELISTPGGTQLSLGGGSEIDPSVSQVEFTFLVRSRAVYNLTFYYEGLDTFESFEFPGQFPDRYPGLSKSGQQLTTSTDDTDGTFTFLEVSADTLLTILFNRVDSDVLITGVGFELVKPTYDGNPYAYSANTGWINFDASTRSQSASLGFTYLQGYAYDANTGWIFLGDGSPLNAFQYTNEGDDHGVSFNSGGNLSGYAWSANTGWISFEWAEPTDPNRPQINPATGVFSGYAWSANLGWISLDGLELPTYVAPNSTDPNLLDFGGNFAENTFAPFTSDSGAYDDGIRDFSGSIDTEVGPLDALGLDLKVEGSFSVVDGAEGRSLDIGLGESGEVVVTFRSDEAMLYNLTFSFEGFDVGERFVFNSFQPDLYPSLLLSGGALTTLVDGAASAFTFSEFPANTELRFIIEHDASGVVMTKITFDASQSTLSDAPYAYAANTGWINLAPNSNTGIVVHETYISGYAYDANTGWIKFGQRQPANGHTYTNVGDDHGINRDSAGALYGYAWSGNVGWIYFGWAAWNDPNAPYVNLLTGDFSGYAWAGNIGWINLGTGQLSTDELRVDDIDLDGMADAWEKQTFGDLTTAGINTDQDGDLISDAAEYVGGTDPLDRSNFLRIVSTAYNGDFTAVTIEFTSDPSRIYTIRQTENLTAADPWSDSGLGEIPGDAGTTTKTFTYPGNDRKFFRVQAALPLSN